MHNYWWYWHFDDRTEIWFWLNLFRIIEHYYPNKTRQSIYFKLWENEIGDVGDLEMETNFGCLSEKVWNFHQHFLWPLSISNIDVNSWWLNVGVVFILVTKSRWSGQRAIMKIVLFVISIEAFFVSFSLPTFLFWDEIWWC